MESLITACEYVISEWNLCATTMRDKMATQSYYEAYDEIIKLTKKIEKVEDMIMKISNLIDDFIPDNKKPEINRLLNKMGKCVQYRINLYDNGIDYLIDNPPQLIG